ncbi:helix-turn-helix domain-containing protein [Thalassospiraceae bacterium SW-3-3]|nr:helix-turn-helix domain-containing protein [Thalassospiraceae bacterium SW-3-3]
MAIMDSLITAAARALSAGDPLGALKFVGLRDDPPALALRGIALAQLEDFDRARTLLKRAARGFGASEPVACARCVVAEAEIALVSRDLRWADKTLDGARQILEQRGDHVNAVHARQLEIRHVLLRGQLEQVEQMLGEINPDILPPILQISHEMIHFGIAVRRLQAGAARAALDRANHLAQVGKLPVLIAEIEKAYVTLNAPAARLIANGEERLVILRDVEDLMASDMLVIDACRYTVRQGQEAISLSTRPVLFNLLRILGESWPKDVPRDSLLSGAFGARYVDETHRSRLRVEIGRLRKLIRIFANITATDSGFILKPKSVGKDQSVMVLLPPMEDKNANILALLADGEAWSSSALAIALDTSARTVQRALEELARADKVQTIGRGRARRWTSPPPPGFTTTLLLPGRLPVE